MAAVSPAVREKPIQTNSYLGMILFLISECFLFGSLFWTYYYLRVKTPVWLPDGVKLDTTLAAVNTFILLSGSLTIWLATRAIRQGNAEKAARALAATMLLGAAFMGITFWEWTHLSFRPWSHAYGSTFYTLTGFHALHVLMGVALMFFLLMRTLRGRFSSQGYAAVEVGALYWHFIDAIWLGVFVTLFIVK